MKKFTEWAEVHFLLLNGKDNAFMKYNYCPNLPVNRKNLYCARVASTLLKLLFYAQFFCSLISPKLIMSGERKMVSITSLKKVIFHHRKEWKQNLFAFYWGHDDNTTHRHTQKTCHFRNENSKRRQRQKNWTELSFESLNNCIAFECRREIEREIPSGKM